MLIIASSNEGNNYKAPIQLVRDHSLMTLVTRREEIRFVYSKKIQISETVYSTLYVYMYRNDSRYRLDNKLQATLYHTIAVL